MQSFKNAILQSCSSTLHPRVEYSSNGAILHLQNIYFKWCNFALASFTRIGVDILICQLKRVLLCKVSPQPRLHRKFSLKTETKTRETLPSAASLFFLCRGLKFSSQNMDSAFSKSSDKSNTPIKDKISSESKFDSVLTSNTTANTKSGENTASNTPGPIKRKLTDEPTASHPFLCQSLFNLNSAFVCYH